MKKTLIPAIALFAALATSAANANPHAAHNEGLQNYYYYFGAPCCDRPMAEAPCGVPAPCDAPAPACGACAPTMVPVEYEQVCTTCDPCGGSVVWWNPMTYFG